MVKNTVAERFWAKVKKSEHCWEWTASLHKFGYGWLAINGRREVAHRVSYHLNVGPIPAGVHVLHKCDNPKCVRPDHLFLGTQAINMSDMKAKNRANPIHGADNVNAKLSDEDVLELRRIYRPGQRGNKQLLEVLAAKYGMSGRGIHRVVRGDTYFHTPIKITPTITEP